MNPSLEWPLCTSIRPKTRRLIVRKLAVILVDLDAAATYYGTLEHRLSRLEEQVVAARHQMNEQADKVKRLMLERDEAETAMKDTTHELH
jgi:hypothetical protein